MSYPSIETGFKDFSKPLSADSNYSNYFENLTTLENKQNYVPIYPSIQTDSIDTSDNSTAFWPQTPLTPICPSTPKSMPSITDFKSANGCSEAPRPKEDGLGFKIVPKNLLRLVTKADHIPKSTMQSLCSAAARLENFEPWLPEKTHPLNEKVQAIAKHVYEQNKNKPLADLLICLNQAIGEIFATSLSTETKELLEVSLRTAFVQHLINHQKTLLLAQFEKTSLVPDIAGVLKSLNGFATRDRYYLLPPQFGNLRASLLSEIEKALTNEISGKIAASVVKMELSAQCQEWNKAISDVFTTHKIPLADAVTMQLCVRESILKEKIFPAHIGSCHTELLHTGFLPASFNDMIGHFHAFASMGNSYNTPFNVQSGFLVCCFGDGLPTAIDRLSQSRIDRLRSLNPSVDFSANPTTFTEDVESQRLWNHVQTLQWANYVLSSPSAPPATITIPSAPPATREELLNWTTPKPEEKPREEAHPPKIVTPPETVVNPIVTPSEPTANPVRMDAVAPKETPTLSPAPQTVQPTAVIATIPAKKELKKVLYTETALRDFNFSIERFDRAMPKRLHLWTYQNIKKGMLGPVERRLDVLFKKLLDDLSFQPYTESEMRDAVITRIKNEISSQPTLTLLDNKLLAAELIEDYYIGSSLAQIRQKIQDRFSNDGTFLHFFYDQAITEGVEIASWDNQWAEYQIKDHMIENLDRSIQALQRYIMEA